MNIRIDSLEVNGLGPIVSRKIDFKDINLIYGKNEQGKTYLVEYILRSIFKHGPKTRALPESGHVTISGIEPSPKSFNPKTKLKIEDYLFGQAASIDLARLCVVKGGDSSFLDKGDEGITKSKLKDYLSDQHILDEILKPIQANTLNCKWDNGVIIGKVAGDLKTLNERTENLRSIDDLLVGIGTNLSMGEINKEKRQLAKIDEQIAVQKSARRSYAYNLSENIIDIDNELKKVPTDAIEDIKKLISQVENKTESLSTITTKIQQLEPTCKHYQWLKTAIEEIDKRQEVKKSTGSLVFLILTLLFIVGTVAAAFMQYPLVTLGAGLGAVLFFFLTVGAIKQRSARSVEIDMIDRILAEFEEKFKTKAKSTATLKSVFESLNQSYFSLQTLKKQFSEQQIDLVNAEKELKLQMKDKLGNEAKISDAAAIIKRVQEQRNGLNEKRQKLQVLLAATQIAPDDYLVEAVETAYDSIGLSSLENSRDVIQKHISDEESKLIELKQRICEKTKDQVTIPWDEVIGRLRDKRQEVCRDRKDLFAQIGAQILINNTIAVLREKEDESIRHALESNSIAEPINAVTHVYQGVRLEGEEILVFNDQQQFAVSNLSTGAQEQVLLGLRLGIASHILQDRKLFLLLDDAFQHSDWNRRVYLVDEMAALARSGWQIIYFTMDDHIANLFEKRIKPVFGERYLSLELKG